MNYPVNKTDFTLYRYVDNDVDFLLRNIDRTPVSYANCVATINIIDQEFNRLVFSRSLNVINDSIGQSRLSMTGQEVATLPNRALTYSVVLANSISNTTNILYTDQGYKAKASVYVKDGPIPNPVNPTIINMSDFLNRRGQKFSQSYKGPAMVSSPTGVLHVTAQLTNFTGSIKIQGSNEMIASNEDYGWVDILLQPFNSVTGLAVLDITGNWNWIRFVIIQNPGNGANIGPSAQDCLTWANGSSDWFNNYWNRMYGYINTIVFYND